MWLRLLHYFYLSFFENVLNLVGACSLILLFLSTKCLLAIKQSAIFTYKMSITRWLKEHKRLNIYVEPRVRGELLTESSYFNFVQTWEDGKLLIHSCFL